MVTISVFGKEGCAKCDSTKRKLNHLLGRWELDKEVNVVFHDMETLDGRAEGAFYDVMNVPVTMIENEGQEVARWDGEVPNSQAVRLVIEEGVNAAAH